MTEALKMFAIILSHWLSSYTFRVLSFKVILNTEYILCAKIFSAAYLWNSEKLEVAPMWEMVKDIIAHPFGRMLNEL